MADSKAIVVTGASRGIGAAIAAELARRGRVVACLSRSGDRPDVPDADALASVKAAFGARHQGVAGLARLTHDQMLPPYYASEEAKELGDAFANRRKPDPEKFGH